MPTALSNDLVIKDFRAGIGPSPHLGFGDIRNIDISTIPGIARLNYGTVKLSGTAISGLPVSIIRDPGNTSRYFTLTETGFLYRSDDSGATWVSITGYGATGFGIARNIAIYQDWLIYPHGITIDVYGPLNSGPTAVWTNSWNTITNGGVFNPMIESVNDGKLYGGNLNEIFTIDRGHATGNFNPTAGATGYVYTQVALDLLTNNTTGERYRVKCLDELGPNLMIGTDYISASTTTDVVTMTEVPNGVIFPWDRTSASYGQPLIMGERGVNQMLTHNNVLYINAGQDAKWYKSNGVQFVEVAKIPDGITNLDGGRFLLNLPNAIASMKDRIFFGQNPGATGNDLGGIGVWSVDPTTGVLNFEHAISTGNMGDTSNVRIGAIAPISKDRMLIGWKEGGTAGIDVTGTGRYASYQGYIDSPLYNVGTPLNKRQFGQLEFQLVRPLATGEGVQISYRTDLTSSFTAIGTYDFATLGSVQSHNAIATIPACEFVQIRVALTCAGTNASPQLRSVTLR